MIMKSISRSGLYYDKFAYKFTIYTRGARIQHSSKKLIQNQYLRKNQWYTDEIYDNDFYFLCLINDILKKAKSENKQVISRFAIYLYTNDTQDIDTISCIS